jgi:hypothetical protein
MPRTMMLRIATAAAVGNCPGSCRHRSLHENVPSLHRDFSCCLVNTVNRCSSPRGSLMLMSVQYRSSVDLVCRTSRGVRCNAQKGFGTSVPKRKGAKSGPAKTPEQVSAVVIVAVVAALCSTEATCRGTPSCVPAIVLTHLIA